MKAWHLKEYGGLDALELVETERPTPAPGEMLIRVKFAALNPADRYLSERLYPARPEFPHILGRDGSGVVEELGEGGNQFAVGDRVNLLRCDAGVEKPGTLAEFVAVPAKFVTQSPTNWSDEESAAAALVYLTADMALNQWGELPKGGCILATGATGGVGVATLHLAKAAGFRFIGLSRNAEKSAQLLEWGADAMFDPNDEDLKKKVREAAGPDGLALIVDNVAGKTLPVLIDCLGFGGRVSVVGMLAGPIPNFNTAKLFFKRLKIGGVAVGTSDTDDLQNSWNRIVRTLNSNGARPVIDHVFEMADLIPAFKRLEEGPLGKVLVKIGD